LINEATRSVTENVVIAAAGNELNGKEIMTLLFDQRDNYQITITEEVVIAEAGNNYCLTSDSPSESDCFYSAVAESDSDDTFYSI
jgi:hypothetical protein